MFHVLFYQWYLSESILLSNPLAPVTCFLFPVLVKADRTKKKYRPRWARTQDPSAPSQNSYPYTRGDCCWQEQKYNYLCKLFHVSSFMFLDIPVCVITCFMFRVYFQVVSFWPTCLHLLHVSCFQFSGVSIDLQTLFHVSCFLNFPLFFSSSLTRAKLLIQNVF